MARGETLLALPRNLPFLVAKSDPVFEILANNYLIVISNPALSENEIASL